MEEERLVLTPRRDRIAALIKAALSSLFVLFAQIFWRTGRRECRRRRSGRSTNRLSGWLGGRRLVGAEYRPWREFWWSVTPTRRHAHGGNAQHRQHETGAQALTQPRSSQKVSPHDPPDYPTITDQGTAARFCGNSLPWP